MAITTMIVTITMVLKINLKETLPSLAPPRNLPSFILKRPPILEKPTTRKDKITINPIISPMFFFLQLTIF